jgi:GT2 family glycosyltransferase
MNILDRLIVFVDPSSNELEFNRIMSSNLQERIIVLESKKPFAAQLLHRLYFQKKLKRTLVLAVGETRTVEELVEAISVPFIIIAAGSSIWLRSTNQTDKSNLEAGYTYQQFSAYRDKEALQLEFTNEILPSEALLPTIETEKIGVLIAQIESYDLTAGCLMDMRKQTYKNFEVYVLDDASSDSSMVSLFCEFPEVTIIPVVTRASYCLGYNIIAKYAIMDCCDYIFILNNDTKDFSKNLLTNLKNSFLTEGVGIASPKIIDFAGGQTHWRPRKWLGMQLDIATEGYMLPAAIWSELDGFNNSYLVYCEDLELVNRLEQIGKTQHLVTDVCFSHLGNGTTKKMIFITVFPFIRNMIWVLRKYFGRRIPPSLVKLAWQKVLAVMRSKYKKNDAIELKTFVLVWIYAIAGFLAGIFWGPKRNEPNAVGAHLLKTNEKIVYMLK